MSFLEQDDKDVIRARGRLKDARKWFAHRGWDVLPQGRRGQAILNWGADHAYLASPTQPMRSVRKWCERWAPWCKGAELDQLLEDVKKSNKRWNHDQCATVLEIGVSDRSALGLRFVGAADDPNYKIRLMVKREKDAARARKSRAARSTGRPRGRPKAQVPAWKAAGYKSKRTYQRHKALGKLAQDGTKNASRHLSNNRKRDGIKVPPPTRLGIDLTSIDFDRFGITSIEIMSGQNVISSWSSAPP